MATTWSDLTASRSVKAVCTTGTEAAPTLVSEGMLVDGVGAVMVFLEAAVAGTVSGGNLLAYIWSNAAQAWFPAPDLNLAVPATAARRYSFAGPSPGFGLPVMAARGRIAYLPSGVTVVGANVTVYHEATALVDGAAK